jgi:hypothetical protein
MAHQFIAHLGHRRSQQVLADLPGVFEDPPAVPHIPPHMHEIYNFLVDSTATLRTRFFFTADEMRASLSLILQQGSLVAPGMLLWYTTDTGVHRKQK